MSARRLRSSGAKNKIQCLESTGVRYDMAFGVAIFESQLEQDVVRRQDETRAT